MKKSRWRHLKNKYLWIGIIVVVIVIFAVWSRKRSSAPSFQYATAEIGNVVETVSVTGTVSPVDEADLAFEKGGVISNIYVSVGQQVKAGDKIASLDSADDQAALASAQATLADMSRSLTAAQYAADQSAVVTASTTLSNALTDAVNAIHNGYVQAQSAIVNYGDSFFTNPQSANPTIDVRVDSNTHAQAVDNERLQVAAVLGQWQSDAASANPGNVAGLISNAEGYLATIKGFLTDLSGIVNDLSPGNSGLSQSVIATDVATMNTALSTLNQAVSTISGADSELTAAQSGYAQAKSTFALQESGSSADAIAAQAAKVAQAQAELAQDTIVSPIDGIVTQEDPSVGEYMAPGQGGFAVQNTDFKVEAYVAEADIAKVAVGDVASSTLDAYGSNVDFPEQVTMIDPSETVLEGVPTYKVTLQFVTPDSRIRSGMTSNLEIYTHEADDVVEIPYRAVTATATSSTVRLVNADGRSWTTVPVATGLKGSDGSIEIDSGLMPGDKVVTYVAGQD